MTYVVIIMLALASYFILPFAWKDIQADVKCKELGYASGGMYFDVGPACVGDKYPVVYPRLTPLKDAGSSILLN